jgi:hypothetical protein
MAIDVTDDALAGRRIEVGGFDQGEVSFAC